MTFDRIMPGEPETSTNLVSWESYGASFTGSDSVAALTVANDGGGFYRIKSTAP